MEQAAIQLGLFVIREAIKHAPELKAEFIQLISKQEATVEDWQALRDKIQGRGYFQFVPKSSIPHPGTAAPGV